MKTFGIIAKIVAALLAVAGAVYVIATYGDKIVAWAKGLIPCKCGEAEPVEEGGEECVEAVEGGEEVVEGGEEVVEATEAPVEGAAVVEESDFEEQ